MREINLSFDVFTGYEQQTEAAYREAAQELRAKQRQLSETRKRRERGGAASEKPDATTESGDDEEERRRVQEQSDATRDLHAQILANMPVVVLHRSSVTGSGTEANDADLTALELVKGVFGDDIDDGCADMSQYLNVQLSEGEDDDVIDVSSGEATEPVGSGPKKTLDDGSVPEPERESEATESDAGGLESTDSWFMRRAEIENPLPLTTNTPLLAGAEPINVPDVSRPERTESVASGGSLRTKASQKEYSSKTTSIPVARSVSRSKTAVDKPGTSTGGQTRSVARAQRRHKPETTNDAVLRLARADGVEVGELALIERHQWDFTGTPLTVRGWGDVTRVWAAVSQARYLLQMQTQQDVDQGVDEITLTARNRDRYDRNIVSVSAVFGVNAELVRTVAATNYNARSTNGLLPFHYEQYLRKHRQNMERRTGLHGKEKARLDHRKCHESVKYRCN